MIPFRRDMFDSFVIDAPDDEFLAVKVIFIIGAMGQCSIRELYDLQTQDVQDTGTLIIISIGQLKSGNFHRFSIDGPWYGLIRDYMALRPNGVSHNHFFLKYAEGRCLKMKMGRQNIIKIPQLIAEYMALEAPESYLGGRFQLDRI